MNEKDLVTFEQAEKLKELGFNLECLYKYREGNLEPNYCSIFDHSVDSCWESYNTANPFEWIDAPFLYQVQNWLREEKKIHIIIEPMFPKWVDDDYSIVKYECIIVTVKELAMRDELGYYDTYNEALHAAINEIL